MLAIACNRSGDEARVAAIVKDLASRIPQPLGALARWYAATGDANRALAAIEQMAARRRGAIQALKNDPAFERRRHRRGSGSLRGRPGYEGRREKEERGKNKKTSPSCLLPSPLVGAGPSNASVRFCAMASAV